MQKLLIAENSEIIAEELSRTFKHKWEIYICRDGYKTIDTLKYLQPEAMVIDLGLPGKSGLEVLGECFPDLPLTNIALSATISPFVAQCAAKWGVDYLFQLPFDMECLQACLESDSFMQDIHAKKAAQHLRVLGFNTGYSGYYYIILAVLFLKKDFSQHIHKEIYAKVAALLNVEIGAIERAIRTAIRSAWRQGTKSIWHSYFPVDTDEEIKCPTNKSFIMCLAHRI